MSSNHTFNIGNHAPSINLPAQSFSGLASLQLSAILSPAELDFYETQLGESLHRIDEQEATRIREVCEWATHERLAARRRVLFTVLLEVPSISTPSPKDPEALPAVSEPMPTVTEPTVEPEPEQAHQPVAEALEEEEAPAAVETVAAAETPAPVETPAPAETVAPAVVYGIDPETKATVPLVPIEPATPDALYPTKPPKGHLATDQLAVRLGVAPPTVSGWLKRGWITAAGQFKEPGRPLSNYYLSETVEQVRLKQDESKRARVDAARAAISGLTKEQLSERSKKARKPKDLPKGYIDYNEAGALLGVSADMVRYHIRKGRLTTIEAGTNRRFVSRAEVIALRASLAPSAPPPPPPTPLPVNTETSLYAWEPYWNRVLTDAQVRGWTLILIGHNSRDRHLVAMPRGPLPKGFVMVATAEKVMGKWGASVPMTATGTTKQMGEELVDHILGPRKSGLED